MRGSIKVLPLIIVLVIFVAGPWYFLKNPLDAAYCLMSGNEWANQGENSRYCKEVYTDSGTLCSTNGQCDSGKCVIGSWGRMSGTNAVTSMNVSHEKISVGIFNNILDDSIKGKCSYTNQDPCYSGEMTVDESRIVHTPSIRCN